MGGVDYVGWRKFVLSFSPMLLTFILTASMLTIMVGTQRVEAAGESGGSAPQVAVNHTANDVASGGVDTGQVATSGGITTPSGDSSTTTVAGSQTDDATSAPSGPTPAPEAVPAPKRVGIQAGHWKIAQLPDELAGLRTATGTSGGGVAEWELNLDIANRVAALLQAEGVNADVLPATIPPGYQADAFVALHADGDTSGQASGFKLARASWSSIPKTDDALLNDIAEEYQAATQLGVDPNVTRDMTAYYAFNNRRYKHAIAPTTPGVILEMGFLTNASDRQMLLGEPETVALGIARGILRFLGTGGN